MGYLQIIQDRPQAALQESLKLDFSLKKKNVYHGYHIVSLGFSGIILGHVSRTAEAARQVLPAPGTERC